MRSAVLAFTFLAVTLPSLSVAGEQRQSHASQPSGYAASVEATHGLKRRVQRQKRGLFQVLRSQHRHQAVGFQAVRVSPAAMPSLLAVGPVARPARATLLRRGGVATGVRRGTIAAHLLPTIVDYRTTSAPGTVVVDTPARYLYLVLPNGKAKRYGIGVGRPGFTWAGTHRVTRKAQWPRWTPPAEMIEREPTLARYAGGMPGGLQNPLGARALYLGSTLYRIHGSNEPWTIGQAVSSGCIRMRNEDVADLYNRVKIGTKVVVL